MVEPTIRYCGLSAAVRVEKRRVTRNSLWCRNNEPQYRLPDYKRTGIIELQMIPRIPPPALRSIFCFFVIILRYDTYFRYAFNLCQCNRLPAIPLKLLSSQDAMLVDCAQLATTVSIFTTDSITYRNQYRKRCIIAFQGIAWGDDVNGKTEMFQEANHEQQVPLV